MSPSRAASDGISVVAPLPPARPAELGTAPVKSAERPPAPEAPQPDSSPTAQPEPSGCLAELRANAGNRFRPADAASLSKDPACHVDEPVVVEALAVRAPSGSVVLEPPPTLSCAMAKAVGAWLEASAQPLAKGYFQSDLTALKVGGGQECRRRNRSTAGPVSEHATGKALDIFAFRIGAGRDGQDIVVEKPGEELHMQFLTAIRQSACGAFMTALGPGSDPEHATHLHVDIQERRSRASRFCQ